MTSSTLTDIHAHAHAHDSERTAERTSAGGFGDGAKTAAMFLLRLGIQTTFVFRGYKGFETPAGVGRHGRARVGVAREDGPALDRVQHVHVDGSSRDGSS